MPPFDGSNQVKAKPGSTVVVNLFRARREVTVTDALARLHGGFRPEPKPNPARFAFYDLATFYQLNSSTNESSYRETDTEIGAGWSAVDTAMLRNDMLGNVVKVIVGGSNRPIERCYRLQANSDETDGLITALLLKKGGTSKRLELIAASETWTEQVPAADRLAALASLPAGLGAQAVAAAQTRVANESLESWNAYSRSRTGADGTIVAHSLDGLYRVAVESARTYYSFDTSDLDAYKVTDEPAFERPEAGVPDVAFGAAESTRCDVWLVPQMVDTTIQWFARYLIISLFGGAVFDSVNTGRYLSRLPFYPTSYNLNLAGSVTNSVAMSERIRRTATYGRMIAVDAARQFIGPLFAVILLYRHMGRWTITQREIPAGQLVGVLRYRYQAGPPLTRYVWRRTRLNRPFVQLDGGSLNIPGEVIGAIS